MQKPASRRFGVSLSWHFLALMLFGTGLLFGAGSAKAAWSVDPVLRKAEKRYGDSGPAKERLHAWHALLQSGRQLGELQQLQAVNQMINSQVRFSDDSELWQRRDYWATPVETLASGAGDCEDFALAKYFTLLQLGVAPDKLRITYARALELNQAHMVVTYYETPDAEPLILDNLVDDILPASRRKDLALRYAFDAQGLYAMKGSTLKRVGNTAELPIWQGLLARMEREGFVL
ncbi:Bacterial transglutaminase-like cysteine proteinase BTLCP [compost metagenome]